MSDPVIKAAFQAEIARVQRNERVLQQVYDARLHAGDANRAVDTAKVALADAVIAAGASYTRDDLVRVARETFIACGYEKDADAGGDVEIVDRLTKGET